MNTSIIIADDHPLMLRGIQDFLSSKGFNVLGSATNGQVAYNLIVKKKPDIALLDIRMPQMTGLEVAEACKKNGINTKIILITFDKDEDIYDQAKALGVYGYILKEFAIEEIETCIAHVEMNETYFSEEIFNYLNKPKNTEKVSIIACLTKSEKKIIYLIAEGLTSQEIADKLCVSIRTIEKHRANIVAKLAIDNKPTSLSIWASLNKDRF
ncbi:response regulator transcription factor [Oceanihabitans sediminis]|uniref:DNA-binding response regulator n=1 Tax=Oceanihabitans sediminis TaxID=1812012 RepID=A0A368P5J7_9FLAO|nr:response regulator transcription factor [Oceanihabitans sediminis]MDX1277805.1 response regulator transcription factor [Oceanihabitans sediminis]MDX1772757.1 response regulator transcription factor [Oceanihabitans sediminis]RBP34428.1 LuxR family two component transcriptional regulator [Oceanihabitans sediminis]RCU58102.1 DNA-binding response regulator [Oceanihabitans sediminis]